MISHFESRICKNYYKRFNFNQVTSGPYVRSSIQSSCSCMDSPFPYPPAGHVVIGNLTCIPDKGLRSLFKKGPEYRLPSRIDFTECHSIVEEAIQRYCKRWCKKEGVGVHALNDWNNEFLRIVGIRIENFTTHPHLYKQPPSRSVKALKRKMGKIYTVNMSLLLLTKQQITSSLSVKDTTWMFWMGNWILQIHKYLLCWRMASLLCIIISILSRK